MKKLKMARGVTLTFEEGCNKYLENCRQRNLREGSKFSLDCYKASKKIYSKNKAQLKATYLLEIFISIKKDYKSLKMIYSQNIIIYYYSLLLFMFSI